MLMWGLVILALVVVGAVVLLLVTRTAAERRAVEDRRKRYALSDTGERVPMAPEPAPRATPVPISEIPPVADGRHQAGAGSIDAASPARVEGRLVHTPDGEMLLTTPPFELRDAVFTHRAGRFINALSRRLPAWVMICPRIRLDSLLTPTRPDGRDPADWRDWRRRVRNRSVDLVLCDRRNWRPLVAVLFDQSGATDARKVAGGQDRIIDEVLFHAGLPLLRLSTDFDKDWPLISPYVEQAILPPVSEEAIIEASDRTNRVDTDGAVTLLRMDQDKGWMLE